MSKHTPGPWEILGGHFVPVELAPTSRMYVIQTSDEHHDNVGFACSWLDDPETLKEAKANANLIARAPDLLADLVAAAATLRRYEANHRAKNTEESTAKAEVNAALASRFEKTIAKARGDA